MKMESFFLIMMMLSILFESSNGESWTDKERERGYKIQRIENGKDFDWTKMEACKDDHPGCKDFSHLCSSVKIVKKICKETCGLCRAQSPPDCRITNFGCCWDNVTIAKGPLNKGCPVCADQYSECEYFSKHCSRADIRKICPVTCGIKCQQCVDNKHQELVCPLYKRYGFCKISPDLMEQMCPKTCGFCPI